LQAELFNEIHRWVRADWKAIVHRGGGPREAERMYRALRDFLKAAEKVWGEAWGHKGYFVTNPVTLKAMIRVAADLTARAGSPEEGRQKRWEQKLQPWGQLKPMFRTEGFYERFPAKGQVERVARIHRELGRAAGIEPVIRAGRGGDEA
jgi:hypothetical protein